MIVTVILLIVTFIITYALLGNPFEPTVAVDPATVPPLDITTIFTLVAIFAGAAIVFIFLLKIINSIDSGQTRPEGWTSEMEVAAHAYLQDGKQQVAVRRAERAMLKSRIKQFGDTVGIHDKHEAARVFMETHRSEFPVDTSYMSPGPMEKYTQERLDSDYGIAWSED